MLQQSFSVLLKVNSYIFQSFISSLISFSDVSDISLFLFSFFEGQEENIIIGQVLTNRNKKYILPQKTDNWRV